MEVQKGNSQQELGLVCSKLFLLHRTSLAFRMRGRRTLTFGGESRNYIN